jgi:hypothetical protein
MKQIPTHPLEHRSDEHAFFVANTSPSAVAAYRRAVEACTGHLPTWAERARPGRKAKPVTL